MKTYNDKEAQDELKQLYETSGDWFSIIGAARGNRSGNLEKSKEIYILKEALKLISKMDYASTNTMIEIAKAALEGKFKP